VAQNPLLHPILSPDLKEQIDFSIPLAKLPNHLTDFFVQPMRLATPVDQNRKFWKITLDEFAKMKAHGFLPRTIVVTFLTIISRNCVRHGSLFKTTSLPFSKR
jgi:hypothetical protein